MDSDCFDPPWVGIYQKKGHTPKMTLNVEGHFSRDVSLAEQAMNLYESSISNYIFDPTLFLMLPPVLRHPPSILAQK